MTNVVKSKYHLIIVGAYILLTPVFFIVFPEHLRYDVSLKNLDLVLAVIVASLLCLYLLNKVFGIRKIAESSIKSSSYFLVIFYAGILIAIPEEVIFRGLVQPFIQEKIGSMWWAVLLSSMVFGAAHLLNGASNISPKGWNWKLAFLVFAMGLPLGLIYVLTNSLFIPTLLHAFILIFLVLSVGNRPKHP